MTIVVANRRRGVEFGRRAVVWSDWRRCAHRHPKFWNVARYAAIALIGLTGGILVGWVLSPQRQWVHFENVTMTYVELADGRSALTLDLVYHLSVNCNRLRLTEPWSLVAFHPGRGDQLVRINRKPSDEFKTRADYGYARAIVELAQRLEKGVRHELSIGLSCLRDANGGTVREAEIAVIVKEFTP